MKLEDYVLKAIDDYESGKLDFALMNSCIAIDATARNLFKKDKATRKDYKDCIRNYYWIIEPMIGDGLNLEETRWDNLNVDDGYGKRIEHPDLADIVYHIFRCNHAHGNPVPEGYKLLPVADGYSRWVIVGDTLYMPERLLWALLAVSVFSKANLGIQTTENYKLTWGAETLGIPIHDFVIQDWWGREDDFRKFMERQKHIRVKLQGLSFGDDSGAV